MIIQPNRKAGFAPLLLIAGVVMVGAVIAIGDAAWSIWGPPSGEVDGAVHHSALYFPDAWVDRHIARMDAIDHENRMADAREQRRLAALARHMAKVDRANWGASVAPDKWKSRK